MMTETGEQQLLAMIRKGDYDSFGEMHRRHYDLLFGLALKKLGDENEAYDLLQDLFTELWLKRADLFIHNPLENYLKNRLWFKLSSHFRAKGFRQQQFRHFAEFLKSEQETGPVTAAGDIYEAELNYEALIDTINRTIEAMPEKMREIFVMSRSNDYSIAEIAAQLDLSPQTVKNQISNALTRLRQATAQSGLSAAGLLALVCLTNI
ncbi:RNA polymerase sigma-70 factor (ECF subfamily) [Mucilaginibacter gracilis]|uniref:RNA polymerase sigma-70 factor (ECF subfamily) n=1 Tax=Mucilaginibacter gracilis TaxID=423350 RepID=A0A495J4V1_9SPHI|nr:sigma-70 family RNA polymerase sigma factor [Mucilaginibacter gracilis]RKR83374.1 RNA polymerase sigma-70 factor (ECF subfamily) [Mucilaginibacter gracilis]